MDHRPPHRSNGDVGRRAIRLLGDTYFDTYFRTGQLSFGADVTGGGKIGGLPERFYVWASVIENGRVAATDYAPDVGWLDPSATTTP